METCDRLQLLASRASFYRMIAQWFYAPLTDEQIEVMASLDLQEAACEEDSPFAEGFNDLYRSLRHRHSGTRSQLAADFTGVFYGVTTKNGLTAQPFESLYRYDGGSLMGEARGEVYHAFKQAQLRVRPGIDLPEDHLSFMAEYMAVLCEKAAECLKSGDEAGAIQVLEQQRAFYGAHLASWFGAFRDRSQGMIQTRFYRGVLKVTDAFLDEEPRALEDLLAA